MQGCSQESEKFARMSSKDLERLETLRRLNAKPGWINGDLYRLMYKHDLFVVAYEKLKSVPGNMTPGADGTTLDEFSTKTIENIVAQLRNESFRFSRARRVHIESQRKNSSAGHCPSTRQNRTRGHANDP